MNRNFHKNPRHVRGFLYKPLSSVPVGRAQTAADSIGSVVPIERLFEKRCFSNSLKGLLQNKSAIAICTKNGPNKTNRPSKEAVLTSFEGRILYIIFGT
ncbi:MAG TPA: hypothetical protein H9835_10170, partial [Candidatus Agathobaculum merdigallinarum]|nr:hypothetical protein [Candidatus Agathobaculum merdigallinarum]